MSRRNPAQPDAGVNPFGPDHLELCNNMLASHAQVSEYFARLAAAGYQVADLQAEADQYASLARGTKAQFFSRSP